MQCDTSDLSPASAVVRPPSTTVMRFARPPVTTPGNHITSTAATTTMALSQQQQPLAPTGGAAARTGSSLRYGAPPSRLSQLNSALNQSLATMDLRTPSVTLPRMLTAVSPPPSAAAPATNHGGSVLLSSSSAPVDPQGTLDAEMRVQLYQDQCASQSIRPNADVLQWISLPVLTVHLTSIQLQRNYIGDLGAVVFAKSIPTALPFLQALSLSQNGIGNIGTQALCDALASKCMPEKLQSRTSHPLWVLDLSFNTKITRVGGQALLNAVSRIRNRLAFLHLFETRVTDYFDSRIQRHVQNQYNSMTDEEKMRVYELCMDLGLVDMATIEEDGVVVGNRSRTAEVGAAAGGTAGDLDTADEPLHVQVLDDDDRVMLPLSTAAESASSGTILTTVVPAVFTASSSSPLSGGHPNPHHHQQQPPRAGSLSHLYDHSEGAVSGSPLLARRSTDVHSRRAESTGPMFYAHAPFDEVWYADQYEDGASDVGDQRTTSGMLDARVPSVVDDDLLPLRTRSVMDIPRPHAPTSLETVLYSATPDFLTVFEEREKVGSALAKRYTITSMPGRDRTVYNFATPQMDDLEIFNWVDEYKPKTIDIPLTFLFPGGIDYIAAVHAPDPMLAPPVPAVPISPQKSNFKIPHPPSHSSSSPLMVPAPPALVASPLLSDEGLIPMVTHSSPLIPAPPPAVSRPSSSMFWSFFASANASTSNTNNNNNNNHLGLNFTALNNPQFNLLNAGNSATVFSAGVSLGAPPLAAPPPPPPTQRDSAPGGQRSGQSTPRTHQPLLSEAEAAQQHHHHHHALLHSNYNNNSSTTNNNNSHYAVHSSTSTIGMTALSSTNAASSTSRRPSLDGGTVSHASATSSLEASPDASVSGSPLLPILTCYNAPALSTLDSLMLSLEECSAVCLAKAYAHGRHCNYPKRAPASRFSIGKLDKSRGRPSTLTQLLLDSQWAPSRPTRRSQIDDYCQSRKICFKTVSKERRKAASNVDSREYFLQRIIRPSITDSLSAGAMNTAGTMLVTSNYDMTCKVWDVSTGKKLHTLRGHTGHLSDCAWNAPICDKVITSSFDKTVKVWSVSNGQLLHTLQGHELEVVCVAVSPDGQLCASGAMDDVAIIWDLNQGIELFTLAGHAAEVVTLDFSPNGKLLATGSMDETVRVWNILDGSCLRSFEGHSAEVGQVKFNCFGNIVLSCSIDQTCKLWDINTGKHKTLRGHTHEVVDCDFSPDGWSCASASDDGTVRVWDVLSGGCTMLLVGHDRGVCRLAFTANGKELITGSLDTTARVWNVETGECKQTLRGHKGLVLVTYNAASERILTLSRDNTCRIWKLEPEMNNMFHTMVLAICQDPALYSEAVFGQSLPPHVMQYLHKVYRKMFRGEDSLLAAPSPLPQMRSPENDDTSAVMEESS